MNKQFFLRLSLALLMLAHVPATRAHNAIPWKFLVCASPLIHSLYTYYDALPHSNPNRYSKERLMKKWAALKIAFGKNKATQNALAEVLTELKYFYVDGLCGHVAAVEGPHHHAPSHKAEMIVIPARGVYGTIGSICTPLVKAGGTLWIVKKASETGCVNLFERFIAGAAASESTH